MNQVNEWMRHFQVMINSSLFMEQIFNKITLKGGKRTYLPSYSQFVLYIPTDNVTKFELSLKFGRRQNWTRSTKQKL